MAIELRCKVPIGMSEALRDAGMSHRDVLAKAGLPLELLDEPGPRVSLRDYFALWRAVSDVSGNPAIGVLLATLVRAEITEPLFLAVLSASDVAGAIDIVARYKRILEPQDLLIRMDEPTGRTELTLPEPDSTMPQPAVLIDSQFAFIVEMCRRGTGHPDLHPVELRLRARSPAADLSFHRQYFGCPIHAGTATNTLVLSAGVMAMPFGTRNPQMLSALESYLRTVTPEASGSPIARVRAAIGDQVRVHRPTLQTVGKALAMSTRALQRTLHDNGTSFREVLDDVRNEHAQAYLRSTSFSTGEVAFLLGFEEESSFSRAFRMWNGVSPATYRRRVGA
jgi:AraC-like DNA-binding protein